MGVVTWAWPLLQLKFCECQKLLWIRTCMATKDCIKTLHGTIKHQSERIEVLESKMAIMEKYIKHLEKGVDDQEQYTRCLCLRIDGIAPDEKESSEECLEKVKAVFANLKVNVPDDVIDRAHRIGRPKVIKGKKDSHNDN